MQQGLNPLHPVIWHTFRKCSKYLMWIIANALVAATWQCQHWAPTNTRYFISRRGYTGKTEKLKFCCCFRLFFTSSGFSRLTAQTERRIARTGRIEGIFRDFADHGSGLPKVGAMQSLLKILYKYFSRQHVSVMQKSFFTFQKRQKQDYSKSHTCITFGT